LKNKDGWSAVQFAAINSHVSIVEFLVKEMGADINTVDRNNRSMLHWACRYGNDKLTESLLKMDIKYNLHDVEKKIPMDIAEIHKQVNCIEVLGKFMYERNEEIKRKAKILEEKKKKEEKDKE
jgi:ankyrin repeat protein